MHQGLCHVHLMLFHIILNVLSDQKYYSYWQWQIAQRARAGAIWPSGLFAMVKGEGSNPTPPRAPFRIKGSLTSVSHGVRDVLRSFRRITSQSIHTSHLDLSLSIPVIWTYRNPYQSFRTIAIYTSHSDPSQSIPIIQTHRNPYQSFRPIAIHTSHLEPSQSIHTRHSEPSQSIHTRHSDPSQSIPGILTHRNPYQSFRPIAIHTSHSDPSQSIPVI